MWERDIHSFFSRNSNEIFISTLHTHSYFVHKDKRLEKASDKKSIREQNIKKYERPSFFFHVLFAGEKEKKNREQFAKQEGGSCPSGFTGSPQPFLIAPIMNAISRICIATTAFFEMTKLIKQCSILSRKAINIEASFEPIVGYACTIGLTSAHPFLISLASPPLKSKQTQLLGRRVRALLPHSPYRKCCDSKDRHPHIFAQGGRQS